MTKLQVTLKELRGDGVCIRGYNKLICALTGKEFDLDRKSYIHCRRNKPIGIEFILDSNGFDDAMWALKAIPDIDRDCRHFAVWCARQVQHLMIDKRSTAALDVAERHADGLATDEELSAAWDAAVDAARDTTSDAAKYAAKDAACDVTSDTAWAAAWDSAKNSASAAANAATVSRSDAWNAVRTAQTEMLRKMCRGEAPWQQ